MLLLLSKVDDGKIVLQINVILVKMPKIFGNFCFLFSNFWVASRKLFHYKKKAKDKKKIYKNQSAKMNL